MIDSGRNDVLNDDRGRVAIDGADGGHVHFLARKPLLQNTRIFKQAKSLADAGYDVTVLGLATAGRPEAEEKNGYRILRVPLDPLHARLLRSVQDRRGRAALERRDGDGAAGPSAGPLRDALDPLFGRFLWPLRAHDWNSRVYRLATSALRPPTVVHANDLDTLLVAFRIARRYRVPLVYDAQELYAEQHTLPAWYRRALALEERLLIRRADRVIAVNELIAGVMERRYGRAVDAVVLNCAPSHDAPAEGDVTTIRDVAEVPPDVPLFVYSGGLLPERGIEETILALKHLPRGVLVVLGEGAHRSALAALVEREGLADRVRFTDYVSHDRVPSFLSSADVGVIPYPELGLNRSLCSPSKLFHYIAAGVPIASSDLPFLRSVVLDERIGMLFDAVTPARIAAAIRSVIEDQHRFRSALAEAQRRYTWEEQERRFLDVYHSLERKGIAV